MKFFLLRLDRFVQFLYTSSVVIGLEFVLSNLRLTVSEGQESPNLFATTTTTDKTTGLSVVVVIGSSSAGSEERLTDGDVIVVEFFKEPCSVTDSWVNSTKASVMKWSLGS